MKKEYGRNQRVGELIQRALADIVRTELELPGGGLITISTVNVSPDLKSARIFITLLGGELSEQDTLAHLNTHAGHLRYVLAHQVKLRNTPRLEFVYDHSVEEGARLAALIERVNTNK